MTLNGIDTSNNNAGVPDATISADFIIFKATEGVGYTDADCNPSYQEAVAAGKLPGVYHFARPDGNDPVSEARWFVSQIQGYLGKALLMLDLEVNPITPEWAKAFMDEVYRLTKVRCVLYMSQSKFQSGDWSAVWKDYAAWPAQYGANNPQSGFGTAQAPVSINGDWVIAGWQYSSAGRLPGYNANLDLDFFYGDAAAWQRYATGDREQPAPAPVETPTPTPEPVAQPTPAPVVENPAPATPPVVDTPAPTTPVVTPIDIEHIPTPEHPIVVTQVPPMVMPKSPSLFSRLADLIRRFFQMMS
jgi:GH25 family lysozyme M1 (1,4-beta-N-acetylmuramidase)